MPTGRWTEAEFAYLKANYPNKPAKQIAEEMGRPYNSIAIYASRLGLKGHQRAGTNSAAHDYFTSIDSHAKAYVLGLVAADGYLQSTRTGNTCQLGFALHAKDSATVEYVRDQLAPGARLGSYQTRTTPMVIFKIQSPQMTTDLAALGIGPRKSLTLPWPEAIPDEFVGSYICGYFDGDGSLHAAPPLRWAVCSGSFPFLVEMQARIRAGAQAAIGGPYPDGRRTLWSIVATGSTVPKIDAWVHAHIEGMARKRLP